MMGEPICSEATQPRFNDMPVGDALTISQQRAITRVGQIIEGRWTGTPLTSPYVPRLDGIGEPLGDVDLAHNRIINLDDPVDDEDAVNKRFFDLIASGLHPKAAVRAGTTEPIVLATLDHSIDGVALVDNDRVLVKNQGNHHGNGIYLAHPGSWTHAADNDTCAKMETASCFVLEGTVNAGSTWFQTTPVPSPCNLATVDWVWELLSSPSGTIQAGAGLDQTGNTIFAVGTTNRISIGTGIDIDVNYAGQDSIGILGTIGQGTWEGDVLDPEFGGTGTDNGTNTISLIGDFVTENFDLAVEERYLKFQLTGPTILLLPTTGRVATLAGNETFTNKHIGADQIDSGTLPVIRGGTGGNSETAAITNLLPSQIGHSGQTLHTDGLNVLLGIKYGRSLSRHAG